MNNALVRSFVGGVVSRLRLQALVASFLIAALSPHSAPGQSDRLSATGRGAQRSESQASAAALFEAGREQEAVQLLNSTNVLKPDTAGWHCETASRLLHIAWQFSGEGKKDLADRVAYLCLSESATAVRVAGDQEPGKAAAALLTAAIVQERFLGDLEAAKASLREAQRLAPDNEASKEALDRFERAERQYASRNAGN